MANRLWNDDEGTLLKRMRRLYPTFSVGATGAPTLKMRKFTAQGSGSAAATSSLVAAPTSGVGYAFGDGAGTRSIARTGVGAYTITLSDSYQFLLGISCVKLVSTTGVAVSPDLGVVGSDSVTTNTATGNGGTIPIQFALNGVAAELNNGDTVTLEIVLCDATEP